MKLSLAFVLTLLALPITSLYAGVGMITPSQLGSQSVSGLGLNPAGGICNVPGVGGCGGGFVANVAGTPNVTLWCVDSQEFDTSAYTANIVSLATPAGTFDNSVKVKYGSVTTSGGTNGNWLYDFTGVTDALDRYQLAAILITMYQPQTAPTDITNPNNDNIQEAIWELTENTSIAVGQAGTNGEPNMKTGTSVANQNAINTLISNAQTTLSGFNFNGWAVVSGGYSGGANGTLLGQPSVQTYLVEVTPEPRFYGLLLVGLLSLCGIIYRRRLA
jgi:hypothetical protein